MKEQLLANRYKIAIAAIAALVISPIIFSIIQGMIGAAIAVVIGLTIVNIAPIVSMKLANLKLKGIKHEATSNPIETLQNLLIEKEKAYTTFKDHVTDAVTARNTFQSKVVTFQKKYPARSAEFENQLVQMANLVQVKIDSLDSARNDLDNAYHKLDEMKAVYDMAVAAQSASSVTGMDTGDLYERIKAETAYDSVITSVNRAFAEIEVQAAVSIDKQDALSYTNQTNVFQTANNQKVEVR